MIVITMNDSYGEHYLKECSNNICQMLNKINQEDEPRSRFTFNRNQKAKSKLSYPHSKPRDFALNKMLKEQSSIEINNHYSSYVLTNIIPRSIQHSDHKQSFSLKRDNMRTEQAEPRIQYTRQSKTRTRWYCEPAYQLEGSSQVKKRSVKNYRVIMPDKPEQFRNAIADRIKRIVKNNGKEQSTMSEDSNMVSFGLNISQIKTVQSPQKQLKKQKPKLKAKAKKNLISRQSSIKTDSFLEESAIKNSTLLSPACNNKELMIKKIDQVLKYKKGHLKLRSQEISSIQKKILKMFDCLDLILNSFHCKLTLKKNADEDFQGLRGKKDRQRYNYYIGGGNNANLVRSLMRKRGWWVQVDSVSKAHFVWSQLRIPQVIEKLQTFNDESWVTDVVPYQQQLIDSSETPSNLRSSKRTNSTLLSQLPKAKQSSLILIFHQKQHKRYHSLLDSRQIQRRLNKISVPQLIHNHYEHNYMFGNKNALYYNISEYYKFVGKNVGDVVPLTFYLEKGNKKAFQEFEKVFSQPKRGNNVWVLKPAQNSNRGMGIEITNSLSFIKSKLSTSKKLIVQAYIKNLLLYNYRKFDIRTYMICLTINGRHKFYWYEEGYIRTASELYDLSNLKDPIIHLTNDAVQKNGQNYGKYEEGNKLSYSEFQRYIDHKFPKENWQMTALHENMKLLAKQSIKATYPRLDPTRKTFGFQLFGLDYIIDNQFKPYLIEINTNPCLQLCSGVLERLIPRMMENMFRICVDPLFRPRAEHGYSKNQSYYLYDESFLDRNRFTLLFDEKYDCDFQWQQRCRKLSGWQWSECEADEYTDEGSFIMVDY